MQGWNSRSHPCIGSPDAKVTHSPIDSISIVAFWRLSTASQRGDRSELTQDILPWRVPVHQLTIGQGSASLLARGQGAAQEHVLSRLRGTKEQL